MNTIKYNFSWITLLFATIVFGQKYTKNINESFDVNHDVLVEITIRNSDITVENWNKNTVSIEGFWEVEGMSDKESEAYFKNWNFEALGNKNKVVISSKSHGNYFIHSGDFDDFDFEMIPHLVGIVTKDMSVAPPMPVMTPMPPLSPMPPIEAPVIEYLKELEFDYEAYQNDKEGYMKGFELRQKEWEKEFEEKFVPQMKVYEKTMKEWEEKMAPKMKEWEEKMAPKMKEWEEKMAPKMKEWEEKMEKKMEKMEKEMEIKFANKMKDKDLNYSKNYKIKKKILIKVPKMATLKVDARFGKIILPDNIKIVN